jgi:hypothetical protein
VGQSAERFESRPLDSLDGRMVCRIHRDECGVATLLPDGLGQQEQGVRVNALRPMLRKGVTVEDANATRFAYGHARFHLEETARTPGNVDQLAVEEETLTEDA